MTTVGPLTIDGDVIPYETWHHTAMPGERVAIGGTHTVINMDGERVASSFDAPTTPGHYAVTISRADAPPVDLSLFVLQPTDNMDSRQFLNGYRIGTYPQTPPEGFIEVSAEDYDIAVSPRFKLGQFLCKQQPEHFPKYVLLSQPNLVRLETLLTALQEDGLTDTESFVVMSGFRTPFYNTAIGSARLSRHMYGDASDIYIDVAPADGVMDDLNRDGQLTKADANFLYDYAADLFANSNVDAGGIGAYGTNAVHGPFVHIDGRGRPARWGR
ncbi:D-Ala-D-Ala carboxypeptidase family metallohydrolase [Parvularcula bermudensis]|nr:D-Ala-D-Ala carboxypeptidase family metallohydrolase [Parvularcula bermudensis]